jgi:hypothetical protein
MKPATTQPDQWPADYQFKVSGNLAISWSEWIYGLTITTDSDGNTVLAGKISDQAAFYGLLARARDLGLTLLTISRTQPLDKV